MRNNKILVLKKINFLQEIIVGLLMDGTGVVLQNLHHILSFYFYSKVGVKKGVLYIYGLVWFGLVWFYGTSTILGY